MAEPKCLIELRVLDGPNRHFAHPTIQLRVDGTKLLDAQEEDITAWAAEIGLSRDHVGDPGTPEREVFALSWLQTVARELAGRGGLRSLSILTWRGHQIGELLVAFPWSREGRATKLAEWIAWAVDDVGGDLPLEETFLDAEARFRRVRRGPRPTVIEPTVPTAAITGTNGKTTTTRLVAHLAMAAGKRVAWNSTDGVYTATEALDGAVLVEAGDWAGFGGAARVLGTAGLEMAVIETARGGLLRRGMGVASVDVGLVTNVREDHMGDMGVHTLEDLAEVKATVIRAVREDGWGVLNADDPRVVAMAGLCRGRLIAFSPDPSSAGLAALESRGARAVTVVDGWIVERGSTPIVPVVDVPMTIAGLSAHNLANALAGVGVALGLGLPVAAIADGLRSFVLDDQRNPGRMNLYARDGVTVIVDIAHNVDSLEALCGVGRGLVGPEGSLRLIVGTMGDRASEMITEMGEVAGRLADDPVITMKPKYLRGREPGEVAELLSAGAAKAGATDVEVHADELEAFDAVLERTAPGDVIAFTVHVHLTTIATEMAARGFTPARFGTIGG